MRVPPDPLRWMATHSYRRALQLQDWWQGRTAPETAAAAPASQPS